VWARFCSMKIIKEVHDYAVRQQFSEEEALKVGI
jgi:hypothetical protein